MTNVFSNQNSLQVIRNYHQLHSRPLIKEVIDYIESKEQKLNVVLRANTVGVLISATQCVQCKVINLHFTSLLQFMISFAFCCHRVLDLHVSTPVSLVRIPGTFCGFGVSLLVYVERALEFRMPYGC